MRIKYHYAWIIVFVTFFTFLAVQGARLSFGAFVEPWEKDFSMNRGTISLISTLSFIIYGISQPIIGRLVDKLGPRMILSFSTFVVGVSFVLTSFVNHPWQLFILYGIVISVGVGGASNVAATVVVTNWFNEKRGLAFGIMEAGFGAGQMLLVPGSLILIQWFNWKLTVVILGLLLMVIVFPVILLFLRNHPGEMGLSPMGGFMKAEAESGQHTAHFSVWTVFCKKQFWFLILPFAICGFTTTGLMDTHLIPFSHDHGFSTSVTSAAVSVLAGFNILGIIISGIAADRWSSKKMLILLYVIRALSICILLYSHHPVILLIFATLFGLVDFATVAPTQMLATQYFKQYSVGFILGWLFLSHQIGSALGAYVPGFLYNEMGNYDLSFYFSIIILLGAAIFTFLLPETVKIKKEQKPKTDSASNETVSKRVNTP
ncbi:MULTISPECIES: MFS transporter [Bacillus amyloliquefaciens group]|uniref:MFS transporter n=1 Tax=Bacillus amyloliquefaciens group TaxID=1938374 RepID=UPI00104E69A8|nr:MULTISPECIES: MFS transporter [Bacillus amyloliquefaciens group]MBO3649272.1 MFS transporter [Bacillus amyloliquefaciens]MCJ2176609.1 MFS transporter [Bacillus amyloliquefaciens]MCR4350046.1 MFS transporter [Bacillus amyloliquefaciens]MCR4359272.1 MFS transporter [Bacillus amyloliquefaciens]MDX7985172.1 MFS transporter [Bacillus velezensis]